MQYLDPELTAQLDKNLTQGPSAFTAAEIDIEEFLNLEEFPIHDLSSTKRKVLVDACRADLSGDGCAHLPNFIRLDAVNKMRDEAARLMNYAISADEDMTPYFKAPDDSMPENHPKRFMQMRTSSYINSDLLEADSLLRKIYDCDVVVHFISDCLGVAPIYRWADPLGRNPYSVMKDGDYFPWHFDGNDFTVSILVQEAESGGDFEYVPNLRASGNENFAAVQEVLQGAREKVKILSLKTGDLQLFKGRYSMHRVTKTQGNQARIIALPTYVTDPYLVNRPHHAKNLYGRFHPMHAAREMQRIDGLTD